MALIKALLGKMPQFGEGCFLAENATIIGDVSIGNHCSIWFNAVIRGDVHFIKIGNFVNIQDGAILHCTYQDASITIGDYVTIGHNAIIHGAKLNDNILVGMGAIIMDHAVIGENSIIAAGALITENTIVEPVSLYAGIPARKIRSLNAEEIKNKHQQIAQRYINLYANWYR